MNPLAGAASPATSGTPRPFAVAGTTPFWNAGTAASAEYPPPLPLVPSFHTTSPVTAVPDVLSWVPPQPIA